MKYAVIILVVAALIYGIYSCNQSSHFTTTKYDSKLNPTTGAFGWNLGDKLPDSAQVETNDSFQLNFVFLSDKSTSPSEDGGVLTLTSDHKICSIFAERYIQGDALKALIQVFTDKYGIRDHQFNFADSTVFKTTDIYHFGTEDRSAEIDVRAPNAIGEHIWIHYSDRALCNKAKEETNQRKAAAQNLLKENLKKQGF